MPIIEVVANTTRLEKPGWTYVLDTGHDPTKAPIQQPGSRKRNARQVDSSENHLSVRQSSALARRLTEYDKDNARDVAILLPVKSSVSVPYSPYSGIFAIHAINKSSGSKPRNAATKKIIDSQRSFAHYLADEEAAPTLDHEGSHARQRTARPRSDANLSMTRESLGAPGVSSGAFTSSNAQKGDLQGVVAQQSLLPDEARLLRIPAPLTPSDILMQSLTSTVPAPWSEIRAKSSSSGLPARHFCDICGYWGRVKCMFCGARLCGLQCKLAHDEDRCQKYLG